ncbi:DUF2268 domain-containing protein [Bacillus carboniphilus]|uniref:DUF2268 domain-containing protein n=1 Tax=Bacillus carboniphilus TaxID=86663 RepID=A0ABY9JXU9_9BACI|nr:DUF2268 domain-containing protein [Bacillus carboniphilus]WLR44226.1 DUF2268 domain-containing protein [Bacillus carboniphilus]
MKNTKEWLEINRSNLYISERLKRYFQEKTNARFIRDLLIQHGLYKGTISKTIMEAMIEKNIWKRVAESYEQLREEWQGKDVPIFILPVDPTSNRIQKEFNGRSGLAFCDKLFLFLTSSASDEDIQAILTHEYHHVVRLQHYTKNEEDYNLLDTIIMEGLAENAVRERLGEGYTASWAEEVPEKIALKWWGNLILPNYQLPRDSRKYHQLLYGTGFYPKMVGYSVGYRVVKDYMKKSEKKTEECFDLEPKAVIQK